MTQFKKNMRKEIFPTFTKRECFQLTVYSFLGLGGLFGFLFMVPINMSVFMTSTVTLGEFNLIKTYLIAIFFGIFLFSCFKLWILIKNKEEQADVNVRA
jgi:hypothetical protein